MAQLVRSLSISCASTIVAKRRMLLRLNQSSRDTETKLARLTYSFSGSFVSAWLKILLGSGLRLEGFVL